MFTNGFLKLANSVVFGCPGTSLIFLPASSASAYFHVLHLHIHSVLHDFACHSVIGSLVVAVLQLIFINCAVWDAYMILETFGQAHVLLPVTRILPVGSRPPLPGSVLATFDSPTSFAAALLFLQLVLLLFLLRSCCCCCC